MSNDLLGRELADAARERDDARNDLEEAKKEIADDLSGGVGEDIIRTLSGNTETNVEPENGFRKILKKLFKTCF